MKTISFILAIFLMADVHGQGLINIQQEAKQGYAGHYYDVCETDNGYYALGTINNQNEVLIWLTRYNYSGQVIWSHEYVKQGLNPNGLPYLWWGAKVSLAKDGGCYILGKQSSYLGGGVNEFKGILIKVTSNGNLDWVHYHDVLADNTTPCDLITNKNGSVGLVGQDIGGIGHFINVSAAGALLFDKTYKEITDTDLKLTSLAEINSGGFALSASLRTGNDRDQMVLIRADAGGKLLWRKSYFSGVYEQGDSIKAYPYSLLVTKDDKIVVGGKIRKGYIGNSQAFVLKADVNGAVLWNEIPLENKYPGNVNDNQITKVFEANGDLYYNFREYVITYFGINLQEYKFSNHILQTGYETSGLDHERNFEFVNKFGQPVFIGGGKLSFGDVSKGLLLTTTPEGLWVPPTLVSIEGNSLQPWMVSRVKPHIEVRRKFQISEDVDFQNVVYEKIATTDSTQLNLKNIKSGTYFVRLGTLGPLNNIIYNDPELFKYDSPSDFATRVLDFSSQYGATSWSAEQSLFAPNVFPNYGDNSKAWASATADGQREYLHLGFDILTRIKAVRIFETFNPGAIDTIYGKNAATGSWVVLYKKDARVEAPASREWRVDFNPTDFKINEIRLAINSPAVPGWNEIDAVAIVPADPVKDENIDKDLSWIPYLYYASGELHIRWNIVSNESFCFQFYSLDGKMLGNEFVVNDTDHSRVKLHIPNSNFLIVRIFGKHGSVSTKVIQSFYYK